MAWIVVAVIVVGTALAVSLRRRSHDDEHSVQGYHRQMHTLEVLRSHAPDANGRSEGNASFPEAAFKVSSHATVRLTEPDRPAVPPVPPPPLADLDKPITFDDAGPVISTPTTVPGHDWRDDRTVGGINHRPRRLAAPAAAVVAVIALVVVLLITGSHNVPPKASHHTNRSGAHHTVTTHPSQSHGKSGRQVSHHTNVTTTTVAPVVSLPTQGSAHSAVYAVGPASYTLTMSATNSQCWVEATEAGSGSVLYSGTLSAGQSQSVTANGPVSLVVGAPNSFAGTINGTALTFPYGFQAPFTMNFLSAQSSPT